MIASRLLALLLVSTSACVAVAGCAAETDDSTAGGDDSVAGDGTGGENEVVAERQLNGHDLPEKTISLTFDDGPGRRTAELADYLAEKGIKGAFFINGMKVPGRQGALDSVIARGHLLANHTQNHLLLTRLSGAQVVKEVTETDAFIAEVQPNGPWVIRAPFGGWNGGTARAINGSAMRKYVGSVFWDEGGELNANGAADWDCWGKHVSVERCGELYLKEIRARKRGVVLMHDIHDKTIDMVKQILPTLIAEGYKFAALQDVPSVKNAIAGSGGGGEPVREDQCPSSTLGHPVDENVCVQSRNDQKWYRCVDGDWAASSGASDARCTKRFPL